MPIVSSEIREDAAQVDGRRHIREVHMDHTGREHHFTWMAGLGQDAATILPTRAAWLTDRLAQQEIDANMQEVESG